MFEGRAPRNEIVIFVGSRKLAAFIAALGEGEARILRHAETPNPDGFKDGFVVSLEKAAGNLEALVSALLPGKEGEVIPAYVVLGNSKLRTFQYSSSQYYQGLRRTISSHEIRSVVEQTRSVATLPLSEFVLQAVPESFLVNDTAGVRNPLGMEANRLGVNLNIFTMSFEDFRNISRAFETADIDVRGYFPKTLVTSEAVLPDQEKEEGALVIDLDEDAAHMMLWKNGWLAGTRVFPEGASCLSARIAAVWGLESKDAEKVKEQFASLVKDFDFGDELIPLIQRQGKTNHSIRRREFHERFRADAKEWLGKILAAADQFVEDGRVFHPHLLLTGEATAIDGFLEFLQDEFSRGARIASARKVEAPNELLVNPALTPVLGMVRWLAFYEGHREQLFEPRGIFEKTVSSARQWFSAYF